MKVKRSVALDTAKNLIEVLCPYLFQAKICGSIRRREPMVGDIDLVVIPTDLDKVKSVVETIDPDYTGKEKFLSFVTPYSGLKVQIYITTPESWGATIFYATGPAGKNIGYRTRAKKMGMKLNRWGLFDRSSNVMIAGRKESDMFAALDKPYKVPRRR